MSAPTLAPAEDAALHRSFCSDVQIRKIGPRSFTTWSAADKEGNPKPPERIIRYRTMPDSCTCPDHLRHPERPCKHIARVRFYLATGVK